MKTKQQLLKEAKELKQRLAQISKTVRLMEVKQLQKTAGLLKENDQQTFSDLVDEIVGKANGNKSQEYDWTIEVLKDHGITDEFKIKGLYRYAIDTNHHRIADACKDILLNKI